MSAGTGQATTELQPLRILDPSDGSMVGEVPVADASDVAAAVAQAVAAAPTWGRTSPADRGALLQQAARALAENAADLARWNERETGKPFDQALEGVLAGVGTLDQYAQLGPVHRGLSLRGNVSASDYTVADPRGVVAALTPWNDPVAVACGILGAALVSGNPVIHKPSERCPHTGELLGRVLGEVFPDGVLTTLTGGAATGALLVEFPGIAVIAHVGSSATGAALAATAARTGAHVLLENGGNDPLLVDADVDPAWAAAQAAIGAFANSGQICTSVERIYVHRGIAEEFLTALDREARERNDGGSLGPLVDERLRRAVHAQVALALAAGATASTGGFVPTTPGTYYPATVLRDCAPGMEILAEETFGPVAPVQVVDSFEEGLELAAAGRYGLAATVLTASLAHAQQAVAALPVGTVKVNNVFGGAPGGSAQPRGASGRGFGYGPELLDEMTTVKVVHLEAPGGAVIGG